MDIVLLCQKVFIRNYFCENQRVSKIHLFYNFGTAGKDAYFFLLPGTLMQHVACFEHLVYTGKFRSLTCATKNNIFASWILHPEDKGTWMWL